jgi:beta-galactosidase
MGGNVHHDHGPMGAVALGRSEERRVEILKAAGEEAGHRQPHREGPRTAPGNADAEGQP